MLSRPHVSGCHLFASAVSVNEAAPAYPHTAHAEQWRGMFEKAASEGQVLTVRYSGMNVVFAGSIFWAA